MYTGSCKQSSTYRFSTSICSTIATSEKCVDDYAEWTCLYLSLRIVLLGPSVFAGTFYPRFDTTFSDRAVRQGTRVFAMDLPEETDTLALGSPFDRGELVSIEVTLDAGLVAKGKEQ